MHPPEKFLIAMIVIGYAAAELMLLQHGAGVGELAGVLLVGAALVGYVFLRAKRAARAAAQSGGACTSCASSSCAACASAPAATRGEPR